MLESKFILTVDIIARVIGEKAFRLERSLNAAACDSIMVGIARRLDKGPIKDEAQLKRQHSELIKDKNFIKACETGTSNEAKVKTRLDTAFRYFSIVK